MTREVTRRRALRGIGSALAVAGGAGGASARSGSEDDSSVPAAVSEGDRNSTFPRYVYQPAEDGGWRAAMPVNVHAHAPGRPRAIDAVRERFEGPSGWRWTELFPDSVTRAWDGAAGELVAPDYSVRRPRIGDEWNHVHAWALDRDRVAIHAHLDVVDADAEYLHSGADYDAAARQVRDLFAEGDWTETTPFDIEYDREGGWGPTGDTELLYER